MKHILRCVLVTCLVCLLLHCSVLAEEDFAQLRTEFISTAPGKPCEFLIECTLPTQVIADSDAYVFLETSRWILPTPRSIRLLSGDTPIYEYSSVINDYVWLIPESERPSGELPLTLHKNEDGTYILTWELDSPLPGQRYTLQFMAAVNSKHPDFEHGTLYPACTEAYIEYNSDGEVNKEYLFLPDVYIPLGWCSSKPQSAKFASSSSLLAVAPVSPTATGDPSAPILFFATGLLAAFCIGILCINKKRG